MGIVLRNRVGYGRSTGQGIMKETCFSLEFTNEGKQDQDSLAQPALLGRLGDNLRYYKFSLVSSHYSMNNTGYSRDKPLGKIGTVHRIGKVSYGRLAYVGERLGYRQTYQTQL